MEKIEFAERYKELVADLRKQGYRLSNCFFLPDTIQKKIASGSLFVQQIENGTLILDDQGGFFRCYYFIPEEGEQKHVLLSKDAVVEFPYNGEMNDKQRLQENKILSLGFQLGRRSGLMTAKAEQIVQEDEIRTDSEIICAVPEDITGIRSLLDESFNPLYAFLPTEEEMQQLVNNQMVFVNRRDSMICAVLVSSIEKGIASIRQIAVKKAWRGQGLGKALVDRYHQHYINDVSGFQHWVDLENTPAISMYHAFGYRFSLRKANEYILVRKEKQL